MLSPDLQRIQHCAALLILHLHSYSDRDYTSPQNRDPRPRHVRAVKRLPTMKMNAEIADIHKATFPTNRPVYAWG